MEIPVVFYQYIPVGGGQSLFFLRTRLFFVCAVFHGSGSVGGVGIYRGAAPGTVLGGD